MVGGAGDDQYSVWSNAFKIIERPGEGIDTLYSYAYGNVTLPDQVENLVLSGPGATGSFGNAMANVIIAGTVGAYLDGGAGDDVLVGGAGLDTFAARAGNGSDAIENFSTSSDLIRLDGYAINGFAQLKAAMTQVGGDVRVALPNGEELVIRGVAASALSASNFQIVNAPQAAVAAAAAPALASVGDMASVVGGASVYLARGWAVLNNNFGSSQLVYGRDYTMTTSVNKTDVTAGTTFNWSFPVVPVGPDANATIKAFPEVIFGVSPYGGGKNPADTAVTFPVQVGSISSLKADFDLAFKSANAGNNVAFDIWLTNKPNGDASTISNEIMVWLHAGSLQPMGQRIGNFVDGDFSASIYYAPESHYIALVANSDTPKGTLDIGKIVAHLAALGIVSPSEYIASVELGAEVASGAGSLTIRNLDLDVRTLNADGTITVKQVTGAGTSVSTLSAGPTLNGTSGNDVLTGKAPADVLKGGAGNDVYYVTDAHQKVIEAVGGGTDTVIAKVSYALTPGQEIENVYADSVSSRSSINLTGNEFNNILYGNAGDNILNGGAGNDTLVANGGRDALIGGTGNDVFIVDDPAQRVIEAVGEGNDTVIAKCSYALTPGQEIENVYADSVSSRSSTNLTGNEFNNILQGNAGDNILTGGAGNDTLVANGGRDTLIGGTGNDVFVVDDPAQRVIEAVGEGNDSVVAKCSYALQAGQEVENMYADSVGSRAAINLTGNEFNNILNGNAGDNILNGGAGNDTLIANGGRDTLIGGTGNDVFIVDDPAQRLIEAVGEGNDSVIAKCSYALQAGQEVENMYADSVSSRAPINLTGNECNNTLNGNAADNVLDGGAGNDTLVANGGRDTLIGGTGNDVFIVDDPTQRVIEAVGEGNDTVIAKCSYALQAGQEVENLYAASSNSSAPINLTGNEFNNSLTGTAGNNVLDGGAGNDMLVGYAGDDVLIGGKGADVLLGGAGNDIFRFYKGDFGSQAGGWDRIADWNQGDRIDLSTARDMVAGNAGFSFVGAGGFTHHAGEVAVSVQGGMTWVSIDSDGDGIADAQIALNGSLRLQASDFLF